MPFVELSVRAQDFLDKLDKDTRERIKSRLRNLENNPVPSDAKFIGRDNQKNKCHHTLKGVVCDRHLFLG